MADRTSRKVATLFPGRTTAVNRVLNEIERLPADRILTPELIDQLESFDGQGARALSVYLNLDPERQVRRSYRAMFKDLVKAALEQLEESAHEDLRREATRVELWLEAQEPRGKGLALFSCQARELWQAHYLPVGVEDHLAFEPKPDVAPLLDLVDEYERYAVALVDKRRARLFTVFMGQIEESDTWKDFVPGKHDQGGPAQARFQRHHEAHVYRHLKRVAQSLTELFRRRSFDRLILAGPEEAISELRRLLPRPLAERLAATIPAETSADDSEILDKTLEVERRIERESERRLLDELFETAGAGGRAAVGLAPTLEALWLDEVQTLVVADGVQGEGGECPSCGRLVPGGIATCPVCGTAPRAVHDLFHRAVARAMEQDAGVEVVHDDAAQRLREAGEGLGALLRFRVET